MDRVRSLPYIRVNGQRQLVSESSSAGHEKHNSELEMEGQILQLKRERETAQLHFDTATVEAKNTQIDALQADLDASRAMSLEEWLQQGGG